MSYRQELTAKYYPEDYSLIPDLREATLKIEITNVCNHRCITCPHGKQMRRKGAMDPSLVRRLIREAGELGIRKAALFLNGEPFLVKELPEYVALCKQSGIAFVFVTTNGAAATGKQIAAVMDAGLDSLKFSINGCDAESYRRVHGRDDFDRAMEHLAFARRYRDEKKLPCRILAGCVMTNGMVGRLDEYEAKIRPMVDDLLFMAPDNFGGYMVSDLPKVYTPGENPDPRIYDFSDKRMPCPLVFNSVNVTFEGYLALCCSEARNHMVLEDLNRMTLRQAWESERVQQIRRRHLEGRLEGMQCYNCMFNTERPVTPMNEELFRASVIAPEEGGAPV